MADNYLYHPIMLHSPADVHRVITPNDLADLTFKPRAIIALTSGNVAVQDKLGTSIIYPIIAGYPLPFRATRILATGTTASLVAWE